MKRKIFCVVLLVLGTLLLSACNEAHDVINITQPSDQTTYEVGISYDDTEPEITPQPESPEAYEADLPYADTEPETTPEPNTPVTNDPAAPCAGTTPETTPEPSAGNTNPGFNAADFEGTWTNSVNETLIFPMPGYEIGNVWHTPNGAYVVEMIWLEGPGEMRVWFFPIGVEMVRYNLLGVRMPHNPEVTSDTSRARMFQGDFEVTGCCPDEKINETLFKR